MYIIVSSIVIFLPLYHIIRCAFQSVPWTPTQHVYGTRVCQQPPADTYDQQKIYLQTHFHGFYIFFNYFLGIRVCTFLR